MEIPISQDIRKYKTKDVGAFSFKEAGFIALGIGAGFLTYKLSGQYEIALIPVAIILIIGFFKPFGMSFIQFVRTVLKENVFTPRVYIWETDFQYEPDDFDKTYGTKVRIPSSWDVIHTEQAAEIYKPTKEEMARYIK